MNKRLFLFLGVLVTMLVAVGGGYLIWNKYFKYDPVKVYQEAERKYIEAMTADTYGGKTPQETLDMFVEALRAGDVELASKYLALENDESSSDYLTRRKWEESLRKVKDEGKLSQIISALENAKSAGSAMDGYFGFEIRDDNNDLVADIGLRFNTFARIWKIESL